MYCIQWLVIVRFIGKSAGNFQYKDISKKTLHEFCEEYPAILYDYTWSILHL